MATAAPSTVNVHPHPKLAEERYRRDAAFAATARDWEGQICDIAEMSDIAEDFMADFTSELQSDGRRVFKLDQATVDRLVFLVSHTSEMIHEFKRVFYEAFQPSPS